MVPEPLSSPLQVSSSRRGGDGLRTLCGSLFGPYQSKPIFSLFGDVSLTGFNRPLLHKLLDALNDGGKASQILDVAVMIDPLTGRVVLLESLPVAILG